MLVRFTLMHDSHVDVEVESKHVETIVDGTIFAKGVACAQITMVSGNKFFVKQKLDEVKSAISVANA